MPRLLLALALALALTTLTACHKKPDGCSAGSIGTCNPGSAHCGLTLTCSDGVPREITCTTGDVSPRPCKCIEAGVAKKDFQIETELPLDLEQASGFASANCGWPNADL
jgi:hypothetical protein